MPEKKLLIIDSNAVLHRAYHALPPLKTSKGEIVNALYGFLLILLKALKDIKPNFAVACFDVKGPTKKQAISPIYKAKRKKAPDELYRQIVFIKEALDVLNVPYFEKPGFEADDLIGTIALQVQRKQVLPKIKTIILTGDMDALQLVNPQTEVLAMRKGLKDFVLYNEEKTKQKYNGLLPAQLQDYRALRGDPSDNIPGVTGIGEKTAIMLLSRFGTLEKMYKELNTQEGKKGIVDSLLKKLLDYKEQAFLSKDLAKIETAVKINFNLSRATFPNFQEQPLSVFLRKFEFFALLKRQNEFSSFTQEKQKKKDRPATKQQKQAALFKDANKEQGLALRINELEKTGVLSKKAAELETKLIPVVASMEQNGILFNLACLSATARKIEKDLLFLESEIYRLTKIKFNINSPKQLSDILFNQLKIPSTKVRKTSGGALSTNVRELSLLREAHPAVNVILRYRELFKLKSGFIDALPLAVNPKTGKIYPHFNQIGAETGRMSCAYPNLQTIPKKNETGAALRKCFQAQKGYQFLAADYSQVELRVAASVSGDRRMIQAFQDKQDIHKKTASEVFGVAIGAVSEKQRALSKTLNFGVVYGMGPVAFAESSGLSRKEAKEFIEKYFEKFSGLKDYIVSVKEQARANGFSETPLGRKRFFPEIDSKDPRLRAQAERMAVNLPLQGYAAEIMKMAMLAIYQEGILNKNVLLLLQIHDELLFEVKEEVIRTTAQKIKQLMEGVVVLRVPLEVAIETGPNWGELSPLIL